MQNYILGRCFAMAAVLVSLGIFNASANATTLTWGVNGVGGSGNWDTSTPNWFNGSQNVSWPSGGDAIFAGASGGTVSSFTFGPVVSSMTFNTPGYTVQDGWVQSGNSGLTMTTNVDATISSTLSDSSSAGNFLVKNGPAALLIGGTNFLDVLQLNQGEVRVVGSSSLFFSDVVLADAPGVQVTLAQSSNSTSMGSLAGGGTTGGVVLPNNQARTVTLTLFSGRSFGGTLEDNGSGVLALEIFASNGTQMLTNVNTYSGATSVQSGTLALSGNGSAANSPSLSINGGLLIDNSGTVVANRISNTAPVTTNGASIQLKGNSTTLVEEIMGALTFTGVNTITVTQPVGATAQLTFAGLQRNDHAVLNIVGPGVKFTGLANSVLGIVPPYITAGNEWATVGGDGRITPLSSYASDINAGSTSDHVKFTATGTTMLAGATTRASLNFQNADSLVPQILDLSGQSLAVSSGGILQSGNGTSTIQNGTLSTASGEIVITANNNLTISASILNGSGGTALTKSGTGILTLTGANAYTGPTSILQGTLAAASDASLGLGPTIELSGGTLKAAGNFSSTKGFARNSALVGSIDTNGFNISFSGPNTAGFTKKGLGALTLGNAVPGSVTLSADTLILPAAISGSVTFQGGTLQANGILTTLDASSLTGAPILDIAGPGPGTLSTTTFRPASNVNLRINFGIGSVSSDFFAITGSSGSSLPTNVGAFLFEFSNLGGATTGVDYPLMSYPSSLFPAANIFAFAPDMAAAGWAGTFKTTSGGVSVRFTAVPEPATTALLLLQGAVLAFAVSRRHASLIKT